MKVKELIRILSKVNPDMKIMVINAYDRALSLKVSANIFEHDGLECDGFHPENKWESNISAGNYFLIDGYED